MKIWSTKYALTTGITEHEVDEPSEDIPSMVVVPHTHGGYLHGEGKDWHRTRESAVKRARSMRDGKIISLKQQISKLECLEFA